MLALQANSVLPLLRQHPCGAKMHVSFTRIMSTCSDDDATMQANLLVPQACTVLLFPLQMPRLQLRMPRPQLGRPLEQSNSRRDLLHKVPHLATFSSLQIASAVLLSSLAHPCRRCQHSMQPVRRHLPSPFPARLPLYRPLLGSLQPAMPPMPHPLLGSVQPAKLLLSCPVLGRPHPAMQPRPCPEPGSLHSDIVLMCCPVLGSPQPAIVPAHRPQQGSPGLAMLLMRSPVLHSPQSAKLSMRCPLPSCPQLAMPLQSWLKLRKVTLLQPLGSLNGMEEGQQLQVCHQAECRHAQRTQHSMQNTLKRPRSMTYHVRSTLTDTVRLKQEHATRSSMRRRHPAKQARARLKTANECGAGERNTLFFEQVLCWSHHESLSGGLPAS